VYSTIACQTVITAEDESRAKRMQTPNRSLRLLNRCRNVRQWTTLPQRCLRVG